MKLVIHLPENVLIPDKKQTSQFFMTGDHWSKLEQGWEQEWDGSLFAFAFDRDYSQISEKIVVSDRRFTCKK